MRTALDGREARVIVSANGVLLPHVMLGEGYFRNNTQTQQIATMIHEALHVMTQLGDTALAGLLMNWGYEPGYEGSGGMTDWIAKGCPSKETKK